MNYRIGVAMVMVALAALAGCSNAASRAGSDLEGGIAAFEKSPATTYTVRYVPQLLPSGCAGRYRFQISGRGEVTIQCRGAMDTEEDDVYTAPAPTHRLEVPHGFTIDKAAGENTYIALIKQDGKIVVGGVR